MFYRYIINYHIINYLTEILPSDQSQITEQARFIHSPLEKAFEKQTKTVK